MVCRRVRGLSSAVRGLLTLAICCACLWGCSPRSAPPAELLQQARAALSQGDWKRAERLAGLIPESSADWVAGRMVAGEAATKAGRLADALRHYLTLSDRSDQPEDAAAGQYYAAEVYRELGQLAKAEEAYRAVLARTPDNIATHERLAFLLAVTGRHWEAQPHYWRLLKSGSAGVSELLILADLERPVEHRDFLENCARKAPDDPLARFGLAVHDYWEGKLPDAEVNLRSALAEMPELFSGQAMLGELLLNRGDEAFPHWHQALPAEASSHPDIWYVRGLWARRQGQLRVAVHCFWRALQLTPIHRRATYQLGQVLLLLDEPSGRDFAERAEELTRLTRILDNVVRTKLKRERPYHETTLILEQMGRIWEACGWALAARQAFPEAEWPHEVFSRLTGMLNDELPLIVKSENLALRYDFSAYPDDRSLFAGQGSDPPGSRSDQRPAPRQATVQFVEQAAEVGIEFVYDNSPDPSTPGARTFEQTGGGVAVVDFDLDAWPDLYFTQGAEWPNGSTEPLLSPQLIDRLYRNLGGRSFDEVTPRTGLGDPGFGQGAAVGDLDSDGFPDLYVANIGRNRLYRNNGDGTFSDVTSASGLADKEAGREWSTSCLVADLNADGLPDLFDVNYLTGRHLYEILCGGKACSPVNFEGVPARLHLSRGDGNFEFVPGATPTANAKGLGLVAFDLQSRNRPSLFIANDQVPNFFLRNLGSDDRRNIRLEEQGFVCGLALNGDGSAMAGMGIAADDANGDGRLDFYVSNFTDESNTLYLQDTDGLFVDATNAAGLRAPSFSFVGWGTQFLDADLDGNPDLVLTNGHIDDYRDQGGQYHMRPQFFRNTGAARFVELFAADAGSYFDREYLGRGLARLDWNRDGRMDFVVSNIGDRASLVTNQSTGTGHFLNLRLHATATARDAIGAVVEVATADRRWTKQLVAGDGYQASNERLLQFGLGPAARVAEVRIDWPSGQSTTLRNLPVDVTIELVEGAPRGTVWRGAEPGPLTVPEP